MTLDEELDLYGRIVSLIEDFRDGDYYPSDIGPNCKALYDAYDDETVPSDKTLYGKALEEMKDVARHGIDFWEDRYCTVDSLKDEIEEKLSEQEEMGDGQKE